MDPRIEEIEARLRRLTLLLPSTIAAAVARLSTTTTTGVDFYADFILPAVEAVEEEARSMPHALAFAQRMHALRDPEALEFAEETFEGWWARLRRGVEPVQNAFCNANFISLWPIDFGGGEPGPILDAMRLQMECRFMRLLGQSDTALERLEARLELNPERYADPDLETHLADRFEGTPCELAVQLMVTLTESLVGAKRDDHARQVCEAFLGLTPALYDDREALRDHLEARRLAWIRQMVELADDPEITIDSPNYSRLGSISYFFGSDLVYDLAWNHKRRGLPDRGATLLGAYFGVWPDQLGSLDRLGERVEQLGIERTGELLSGWLNLVEQSGRFESILSTFAEEFGAAPRPEAGDDRSGGLEPSSRWFGPEGGPAALLLRVVVAKLNQDRPETGFSLYLACAGLDREQAKDSDDGGEGWLAAVEPEFADPLVFAIMYGCFLLCRWDELVALLERCHEITAEDYKTTRLRDVLEEHRRGRAVDRRQDTLLLALWLMGLIHSNRIVEAYFLIPEFYPSLFAGGDAEDFGPFLSDVSEQPVMFGSSCVFHVARALYSANEFDKVGRLVESYLERIGIEVDDDRRALGRRMRRDERLGTAYGFQHLFNLSQTALVQGKPADGIALIEGYLGMEPSSGAQPPPIGDLLAAIPSELTSDLMPIWLGCLIDSGRAPEAVGIIEAFLGWSRPEDYSWRGVSEFIASNQTLGFHQWMLDLKRIELAHTVLAIATEAGETAKRDALLQSMADDAEWLDAAPRSVLATFFLLTAEVLDYLESRDPARCLEYGARAVAHLRQGINRDYLSPIDRERLANDTAAFRRRLTTVGHGLAAAAPDPARAEELRRLFLCWDAELGQRVLLERFLNARPAAGADGADEPVPRWACRGDVLERLRLSSYTTALGCFERRADPDADPIPPPRAPDARLGAGLAPLETATREEFAEELGRGVSERELAAILGTRRRLLRAGFSRSGRLVWTLFEGADGALRAVVHGATPAGLDARAALAAAVHRHDEAVAHAWESLRVEQKGDDLKPVVERLARVIEAGDPALTALLLTQFDDRLTADRWLVTRDRLRAAFPAGARIEPEAWRAFWRTVEEGRLDAAALESRLDRATAALLDEAAALWPTADLAAALDAAPEIDLILQVDDVLHSVPIAFLKHDGRYLFERVRSTHAALSLSLARWLQDLDERAVRETCALPDKVLSLSWFEPRDLGARLGAEILHRGHQAIAARLDRSTGAAPPAPPPPDRWFSAADEPRGSHACLSRALDAHRAFRVVSVCGHGRADLAGIELADGVWSGSVLLEKQEHANVWNERRACDLLGVEFLIQVSCSIGRVRHSELQDVEGFCVELAVHRARSVLAGLWPLHSRHSPLFANRVSRHYLNLRRRAVDATAADLEQIAAHSPRPADDATLRPYLLAENISGASLRARALAAARRDWLKARRQGRPAVGLNTIAAFELYGLG